MSENATPINDGKVNVAGVDINIKQVLGDMIAQQVTSSFTEEQMQQIIDYIQNEIFVVKEVYDANSDERKKKYVLKMKKDYWNESAKCEFLDNAKKAFATKVASDINDRISEIIASEDYKDTVDKYAQEIVQYATEGWKNDMIARIRMRMTSDVMDQNTYCGVPLRSIIVDEIQKFVHR